MKRNPQPFPANWRWWFRRLVPLWVLILSLIIFYVGFVNHIEPNQIGLARNHASGETWVQTASWHLTPPWVWVSRVESNPIRVGVPTAGRGFSAKLVRFLPEKADDFLNREGWRYYWWDNRISFNFGHADEYRGFRNIILGYAYAKDPHSFLEVIEEYER